jgi:hypothetical protein
LYSRVNRTEFSCVRAIYIHDRHENARTFRFFTPVKTTHACMPLEFEYADNFAWFLTTG